jgi:hypothetical protein
MTAHGKMGDAGIANRQIRSVGFIVWGACHVARFFLFGPELC